MNADNYSNLHAKRPWDFTGNIAILEMVLPYVPQDCERMAFLESYYIGHPEMLAAAFLELAELLNNDSLATATREQFEIELKSFFNE